jgi:acetolactate synthase-1/3 small subunit
MRHTLSILIENRFGELARIVGLFDASGYNIESLTVAETLDAALFRVTLVTSGDDLTIDLIIKQLEKQIRARSVADLTAMDHIERELMLVHVNAADGAARHEVLNLVNIFRARVIDVSEKSLTIETTGDRAKVNAFLRVLGPFGIHEMVRAGTLAIGRLPASKATSKDYRKEVAVSEANI